MLVWLSVAAFADPCGVPWEALADRFVRARAVDVPIGQPVPERTLARRLFDGEPLEGWDSAAASALTERFDPETAPGGLTRPIVVARPCGWVGLGDLAPSHSLGDTEPGIASVRAGARLDVYAGLLEAEINPEITAGKADLGFTPGEFWLGMRTGGFHARVGQQSVWLGPAHDGSLIAADGARPLPGFSIGGDSRLPKKAAVLGRLAARLDGGWIPGARRDVNNPGWLLMDLRYQPVPWIEIGASRNAVFGGRDFDGRPRPVDIEQLLVPTEPHVVDDPDRRLADTDERAAIDARVSVPLGLWWGPVDVVELYVQNGGEDVIGRNWGPVPVPTLAGQANVYGAMVQAGPWLAGGELAVLEDDLFRWYTGHRVYHDGWTADGLSLGHPQGGDQQTWSIRASYADPHVFAELRYTNVHRVLIADLLQDTLFVFPGDEIRDQGDLRVGVSNLDGHDFGVQVGVARVRNVDFVPLANEVQWRIGVSYGHEALVWP